MRIAAVTFLTILLAAGTASAQHEVARTQAVEIAARVPLEAATKGAPYSADSVVEGVQALADGNRIVRRSTGRVYRDSEGRTRREDDRAEGGTTISIVDPVAGFSYSLDAVNRTAWRTPAGTAAGIMSKIQAADQEEKAKMERALVEKRQALERSGGGEAQRAAEEEKLARAAAGGVMVRTPAGGGGFVYAPAAGPLEHKVIDGVAVEGRKTTTVIPAGKIGNEQPLTIVSEEWRSPELNVLVLTRHSDPRTGDSSYRLTNIIRAEPDPSLFTVPPDYTVKDTGIRKMEEAAALKRREK